MSQKAPHTTLTDQANVITSLVENPKISITPIIEDKHLLTLGHRCPTVRTRIIGPCAVKSETSSSGKGAKDTPKICPHQTKEKEKHTRPYQERQAQRLSTWSDYSSSYGSKESPVLFKSLQTLSEFGRLT